MKINNSQKVLIFSGVVLIITIILDAIFGNLLLNKIVDINNKIRQQDISSQARLQELQLRDSIDSSGLERDKLNNYFVGSGNLEVVAFTEYLEDLAVEKGVVQKKTLNYEALASFPSSEFVSSIRYRTNISGKWSSVFAFIQAIENLPKAVFLNNISVGVNSDINSISNIRSSDNIWSADLDFSVVNIK